MENKTDKLLLILLIFLIGFINIGITITVSKLLLNYNAMVSNQLLEIQIMVLIVVVFNYIALLAYRD